ncbi:MAG: C10 family peptidase [Armatimonadetes bacterium]|nr:C10 family peptidase [Armatimonadota bacterium]
MSRRSLVRIGLRSFLFLFALAAGPLAAAPVGPDDASAVARAWLTSNRAAVPGNLPAGPREFADTGGQRLAYVYDLSPAGFVVVPADDTVEPILVYSRTGRFVEREGRNASALADMLRVDIPARIRAAGAMPSTAPGRWASLRAVASGALSAPAERLSIGAGPLLTSTWDQGDEAAPYTYDYYTPNHYVCGCVATAMAQVVRFHHYPSSASVSNTIYVDDVPRSASWSGSFNYGQMPDAIDDSSPDAQRQEIGKLTWACGISVSMQYSSGWSGAYQSATVTALKDDFGYESASYKPSSEANWGTVLRSDLTGGYPCLMSIYSTAGGHSIVCDGWATEGADYRYHLNMGWSGSHDAWYQVPGFTTGAYTWSTLQAVVWNIRPTAAPRLNFVVQPTTTTRGANITPAVKVEALTATGVRDTSFNGTVTVSFGNNPGGATLAGTLTHGAVSGVATFDDLSIATAGMGYVLQASATGRSSAFSNAFSVLPAAVPAPFRDDFSTDKGWLGYAADGWERGPARGTSYDPASDTTPTSDNYLLGYNIGGNYQPNLPETRIMTPPIDCSALTTVKLVFQRALTVEDSVFDHAQIEVSTDGVTWTTLWTHSGDTLEAPTWARQEFDLTAVAAGQPRVIVSFVMGASDEDIERGGWSIDDFYVGSGASIVATPSAVAVTEGGSSTFNVKLSEQPEADTVVTTAFGSGDGDLTVGAGATRTFTVANWNTPQAVTINAAEDTDTADGAAVFNLSAPNCAGTTVTANERDNDVPRVLASVGTIDVPEGSSVAFDLTLSSRPASDVAVTVARASGDSDLAVAGGAALTFTATNWSAPQRVTVAAAQDADAVNGAAVIRASATGWEVADINANEVDDELRIVATPTSVSVPEDGTQTFTVRLAGAPAATTTVALSLTGDPDISISSATALSFTTGNWNAAQTVTVRAAEDADAIAGTATLRAAAAGWRPADVVATEVDNDLRLNVSPLSLSVGEGASRTFAVRLAGQPAADVVVATTRASGDVSLSPIAGGSLTFTSSNWNEPQTVTIGAAEDEDAADGSADIAVAAPGWTGAGVHAVCLDNDKRLVATPVAVAVPEGGTRTFALSLAGRPADSVPVYVGRLGGDSSLSVTAGANQLFSPENWNTPRLVTLSATEDIDAANGEAVFRAGATGWMSADVTATEVDNDLRIIATPTMVSVPEGGSRSLNVRLAGLPAGEVAVRVGYAHGDTSLQVTAGANLTFGPSNWNVAQTVTIGAQQDADVANGEAIFRAAATSWLPADVAVTEVDDDLRLVASADSLLVPEGGTRPLRLSLGGQPTSDVVVTVARVSGDTDLRASATLVFTPADWYRARVVTVSAVDDVDAINGTATLRISAVGWTSSEVQVTEVDNDGALRFSASTVAVHENGTSTVGVSLAGQPGANVTVAVARASGDTDLRGSTSLTFTPSNWNVAQRVTIAAVHDIDALAGQAVFQASAVGWSTALVTATEVDDDARVLATPNTLRVAEGASRTFTVQLAGRPGATTFVNVGRLAGDSSLRVLSGASLAFSPADWNRPQTVTVAASEDDDVLDSVAHFSASSPGWQAAAVTATEEDNDRCVMAFPVLVAVPEGRSRSIAVRLGGPPASAVTVNVSKVSGDADLQLSGSTILTFTSTNWFAPQYVTVAAAADADRVNGSALFRGYAEGWQPVDIVVTEIDGPSSLPSAPPPPGS